MLGERPIPVGRQNIRRRFHIREQPSDMHVSRAQPRSVFESMTQALGTFGKPSGTCGPGCDRCLWIGLPRPRGGVRPGLGRPPHRTSFATFEPVVRCLPRLFTPKEISVNVTGVAAGAWAAVHGLRDPRVDEDDVLREECPLHGPGVGSASSSATSKSTVSLSLGSILSGSTLRMTTSSSTPCPRITW